LAVAASSPSITGIGRFALIEPHSSVIAVDREHAVAKADIDLFQPSFQCDSFRWIMPSCELDPFANLSGDEHAQIHLIVFD
jgi:hypothetical protein